MPAMRRVAWLLLLGAIATAAEVSPAALAAADAWAERAIGLGFPDCRGATAWLGRLQVVVPRRAGEHRPVWEAWWPLQPAGGLQRAGAMVLALDGVHLRLADGRWLAGCQRAVDPRAVEVAAEDLRQIPGEQISAHLRDLGGTLGAYRRSLAGRELALWQLALPGRADRLLPPRTYLVSPWQPLLSPCSLGTGDDIAVRWGPFLVDADLSADPDRLLPRMLRDLAFSAFAAQAIDPWEPARAAAGSAAAACAPDQLHQELQALFAAVDVALSVPPWQPGGTLEDMLLAWGDGPPPAPELLDLDALAALLDDQRICAWLDRGLPRTCGDNALRGIAHRLGCDPRLLAGVDPGEPWLPAVRPAAVAAVRRWWQANRGRPLAEALAERIRTADLRAQARLAGRAANGDQPGVLAAIAAAWLADDPFARSPDPSPAGILAAIPPSPGRQAYHDRHQVDLLLASPAGAAALRVAIERLPEHPQTRLPLALADDLRGEPARLDALLGLALLGGCDAWETRDILHTVQLRPSPARLATCRDGLLAGRLDQAAWRQAVGWLLLDPSPQHAAQLPRPHPRRPGQALRVRLLAGALDDRRVVDAALRSSGPVYSSWICGLEDVELHQPFTGRLPGAAQATALAGSGLRLCDLAAFVLAEEAASVEGLAPAGLDPTAAVAERDAAIAELRPRAVHAATALWRSTVGAEP